MPIILVTGGAGYIGSHTTVQLLMKGFDVCIIDSLKNSSETVIIQIRKIIEQSNLTSEGNLFFRKGDLRDGRFLNDVFTEFQNDLKTFEYVIHFAGLKSVEQSVINPLAYWEMNLSSTLSLIEVMDKFNCYKLVFSSSALVYEPNNAGIFTENSPKKPINPYGKTKLAIEEILMDLSISNNEWKIANLRYFNPAGAHESSIIGENPLNRPTNLFPIIAKVALGEFHELFIYGNDWPTKDGTCLRDYIHIMDLAEAHIAAIDFLENNDPQYISFNIGTGKGTSVLEIVHKFMEVNNVLIPYEFKDRRKGDPSCLIADNSKALKLLKWKPQKQLHNICVDLWKFVYKSN